MDAEETFERLLHHESDLEESLATQNCELYVFYVYFFFFLSLKMYNTIYIFL